MVNRHAPPLRDRSPARSTVSLIELAARLREVAQEQVRLQATLSQIAVLLPQAQASPVPGSGGAAEYMTVAEVARLLKVNRTTIYAWMDQQGLPFQYVGSRRRVRRDALEAWLADQRDEPRP